MFVLVATTVIVVLVVYVLSFLTQDILYLKRFLCVCVCVCVPLLHLNHTRRHFHVSDFITQWGRVRECSA